MGKKVLVVTTVAADESELRDELGDADEIVVLTRPGEDATWLEDEAARKALEAHGIPVRHLELRDS